MEPKKQSSRNYDPAGRKKRIISIFVVWVLLYGVFLTTLFSSHKNRNISAINDHLHILSSRIEATVKNLEQFSKYVYDTRVNSPEITAIMEEALTADDEARSLLRSKLYGLMEKDYETLLNYNFRQLHFHLPDTSSFLRMHTPEYYGDFLGDIRVSIARANTELVPITGFEEGRIFNGYRFVYPLFSHDRHCGSVEVSFSMQSFLDIISDITPCDIHFIVDKVVVEGTVFDDMLRNYQEAAFSDQYLYDRNIISCTAAIDRLVEVTDRLAPLLLENTDFGFEAYFHGESHLVLGKSVNNIKDIPVAWIIMTEPVKFFTHNRYELFLLIITGTAVFVLAALLINFFLRDRERLRWLSGTDLLTGAANRASMYKWMRKELLMARREKYPISVLLFDIDHFKSFNDEWGHAEGDLVLCRTVDVVKKLVRSTDFFARWGGEEFLIGLSHCTIDTASTLAEKIRKAVAETPISEYRQVTISIGVAILTDTDTSDSLIARSDSAMYRAKQAGRNCVSQ